MKKISVLLSAALVMFALNGCQNDVNEGINIENNAEGTTFVLSANINSTRTTTDATTYEVEWEDGDVIYLATTDEEWGPAYSSGENSATAYPKAFTYSAAEGLFTSDATISDGEHTFNAIYEAESQRSYHRGASTTHKLIANQTMDAENPTATLKENDALAGQFTLTTPTGSAGSVTMKHLYALMQVNIKNNTGADITITNFMMATTADLAGVFNVTFGETPSVSIKSGASDNINVAINNGTVANGETLPVYFLIAPLANHSGEVKFVVTDTDGNTYTKAITVSNLTFAAGTYNTTPYTITEADSVDAPEYVNNAYNLVTNVKHLTIGDKVVIAASGYDKAMGKQNNNNRASIDITKNTTNNTIEFYSDVTVFTLVNGTTEGTYAFQTSDNKYIYAAGGTNNNYLKEEESLSTNSSWAINITDGVATIEASNTATTRNKLKYNNATTNGNLFSCYSSSSSMADVSIYKLVGEYTIKAPVVTISGAEETSIAYDATSGAIALTLENAEGWEFAVSNNADWLSEVVYDAENSKITFVSTANEEEDDRTATITITATNANYDEDVKETFSVKQAGKPSGDIALGTSYSYTFTTQQFSENGTKTLNNLSWTLSGDGGYWGYNSTKGQQFGSSGKPYKSMTLKTSSYSGGVKKITINTSGASSIKATLTITVGGKQIGATKSLTATATSYIFESTEMLTGDIVLTYTQTSSKAIYIKSIAINQ